MARELTAGSFAAQGDRHTAAVRQCWSKTLWGLTLRTAPRRTTVQVTIVRSRRGTS